MPQLQRLVLDGCNIETTFFDRLDMQAGVKAEDSIFFGLLYLTELSLKDNKLKHLIALQGIVASANFIPESEQMGHDLGREYEQKAKPRNGYTLKKIWIDDNPILSFTKLRDATRQYLRESLPSIAYIDDQATAPITALVRLASFFLRPLLQNITTLDPVLFLFWQHSLPLNLLIKNNFDQPPSADENFVAVTTQHVKEPIHG